MPDLVSKQPMAQVNATWEAMNLVATEAEQAGAVLHVTLNRPESRNAMRVVVLRGAGGHFCTGADWKDMAGARMRSLQKEAGAADPIAEVNAEFCRLCAAYAQTPMAVVAVLEGTVMGGGFGLACAPSALAATKALMQRARLEPAPSLVADAAAIVAQPAQSAEGIEGMTAFIQKRKPNWTLT